MITRYLLKIWLIRTTLLTSTVVVASLSLPPLCLFKLLESAGVVNFQRDVRANNIKFDFSSRALAVESKIAAEERIRFRPRPHGDLGEDNSVAPGSRGVELKCPSLEGVTLTPLAPYNEQRIDLTASGHPNFFWYVKYSSSVKSVPIRFILGEDTPISRKNKVLIDREFTIDSPGLKQLQMPKELPDLVPNRDYYWTIVLKCQQSETDKSEGYKFWMKRELMTPKETSHIEAATSSIVRARIYANLGYWYDAVNEMADAAKAQPKDSVVLDEFISLLNQGNIDSITTLDFQKGLSL